MKDFFATSKSRLSSAECAKDFQSPSVTPKHAIEYASLKMCKKM